MPPQTTVKLTGFYTRLPAGHISTTECTYRYQIQPSNNTIWDNVTPALYGFIVAWNTTTTKWELPSIATKDNLLGVVMFDANFIDKAGYARFDLLNLEVIGDRVLACVAGITIRPFDAIHVVLTGANAGRVTNVPSSVVGSETRRIKGHFSESKTATDINCNAFFELLPAGVVAVGI